MWDERIQKQAQHFENFASQILQFDLEVVANAGKIKALHTEHAQLVSRQVTVDQSLEQIKNQQESLQHLLCKLQEELKLKIPDSAGEPGTGEPGMIHQRARILTSQLDELDGQTEDLVKVTKTVQSKLYTEPLTTVVRVLDAHASALDTIQGQINSMTQHLKSIEGVL